MIRKGGGLARILLVFEFKDVFWTLQVIPSDRSEPFTIELEPGTAPLSKSPDRMAPVEMLELKMTTSEKGP